MQRGPDHSTGRFESTDQFLRTAQGSTDVLTSRAATAELRLGDVQPATRQCQSQTARLGCCIFPWRHVHRSRLDHHRRNLPIHHIRRPAESGCAVFAQRPERQTDPHDLIAAEAVGTYLAHPRVEGREPLRQRRGCLHHKRLVRLHILRDLFAGNRLERRWHGLGRVVGDCIFRGHHTRLAHKVVCLDYFTIEGELCRHAECGRGIHGVQRNSAPYIDTIDVRKGEGRCGTIIGWLHKAVERPK